MSNSIFQGVLPPPTQISRIVDPFDFHLADTPLIIRFYGYRSPLPETGALSCIDRAKSGARSRRANWNSPIHLDLGYHVAGVVLTFFPNERTTWRMWYNTTEALQYFFVNYVQREMSFFLRVDGQKGLFGHGILYLR